MALAHFVLGLNVVWFLLGFRLFSLQPQRAIRLLVPLEFRQEHSRQALVEALPFLGGMNLAFAVLSAAALLSIVRHQPVALGQILIASGLAHLTQLVSNLPGAVRGGRAGGASWDVLRGLMLFIFVIDGVCTLANALALALA